MTPAEKLHLIQKLSGLTQEELASKIGVTFAAFNRWFNEKANPRHSAAKKIDELYREFAGVKTIPPHMLAAKKDVLNFKHRRVKNALAEILKRPDLQEQFDLSLTYHSNRIEGSSLTEGETGAVLFHNKSIPNKSLTDQIAAKNHQAALHFLFESIASKKNIDEKFLLELHAVLMNSINPDAGRYRSHGVRIVGTHVVTANFMKIPILMEELMKQIHKNEKDIVSHIAFVHARFEQIHPFGDGNGRVGRLLMQAMLLQKGFPPALIRQEDRPKYFSCLSQAQLKKDYSSLEDLLCDALLEGYAIIEN